MKRVGKTVHEEKDSSWSPRGSLKKVTATIREGMQTLTELAQAASVTTLDSDAFTFDFSITEDDLIPGKTGRELFLDKFSEKDVAKWMEDKGVLDILRKKGFKDCVLDFDLSGMTVDKFRIYDLGVKVPGKNGVLLDCKDPLAVKPSAKNNIMPYHLTHDNYTSTSQYDDPAEKPPNDIPPIVEAAIRLKFDLQKSHAMRMATAGVERDGDLILPRSTHRETYEFLHKLEEADVNFLYVEWLLLQNVTKELDGHLHNALPGQLYPGLGIMEPMAEILLTKIVEGRDVVLNNPLYFHNAIMYRDLPGTVFLNPEYEGKFRTLVTDLQPYIDDNERYGLSVVSRALFFGNIIHKPSGKRVRWDPQEQAIPCSKRAWGAISANDHFLEIVEKNTTSGVFSIDLGTGSMVDLAGPWPVEVSINDEPVVDFEFGCDSDCDDECECESPVIDQEDQLPSVTDKGDADGILLSDVDTRPLPKSPRHSLRTSPMPSPQNSSSDLNVHNVDSKRSLDNCTSHFEHGVARAASHDYGSHLTAILSPKRSLSSAGTSGETSPISKGGQRSPLSNPSATNPNVRRQRRSFNA